MLQKTKLPIHGSISHHEHPHRLSPLTHCLYAKPTNKKAKQSSDRSASSHTQKNIEHYKDSQAHIAMLVLSQIKATRIKANENKCIEKCSDTIYWRN